MPTFGANALLLATPSRAGQVQEINIAAARLALEAAGARAWVAGSIGPVPLAPRDEGWNEPLVRRRATACPSPRASLALRTRKRTPLPDITSSRSHAVWSWPHASTACSRSYITRAT